MEVKRESVLFVDSPAVARACEIALKTSNKNLQVTSFQLLSDKNSGTAADENTAKKNLSDYAAAILHIVPSPKIVAINANLVMTTGHTVSDCDGLRLAELLLMEKDFESSILIYSWLTVEKLKEQFGYPLGRWRTLLEVVDETSGSDAKKSLHTNFTRLQFSIPELTLKIQTIIPDAVKVNCGERLLLAHRLLEEELERICRGIRHNQQNIMSSLRLLLGSYVAGDISSSQLQNTARRLGISGNSRLNDLEQIQNKWLNIGVELEKEGALPMSFNPPQEDEALKSKSVLVIDDHFAPQISETSLSQTGTIGDFGWEPVYQALLQNSRRFDFNQVSGANSVDKLLALCPTWDFSDFALIILDVDLGDPRQSGLHLLREIRSRDPFVPILMMTSFDDAEVCQAALELQADAFFVKQLRDTSDRSSLHYYLKFTETLDIVLDSSFADRQLYQIFVEKLPVIIYEDKRAKARNHCARFEEGVLGELTKFFLLLRVVNRHHLARNLLTNSPDKKSEQSNDELLVTLLDAVIAWLNWSRPAEAEKIEQIGSWLKERRGPCNFSFDLEGKIRADKWDQRTSSYFGYQIEEIIGEPVQKLFEDPEQCPAPGDLGSSATLRVFLKKKILQSEVAEINIWRSQKEGNGFYTARVTKSAGDLNDKERFIKEILRWQGVRHGELIEVSLDDVRELARKFLDLISGDETDILPANELPGLLLSDSPDEKSTELTNIVIRARRREKLLQLEHSVRSKMGAQAALLGSYFLNSESRAEIEVLLKLYQEFGPGETALGVLDVLETEAEKSNLYLPVKDLNRQTPPSVMLIDDHGTTNGWAYVIQVVYNDSCLENIAFTGGSSDFREYVEELLEAKIRNTDLIFLDLKMPRFRGHKPSIQTGLETAKIIKELDPLIPLVLLSAHSESIAMRRAIFSGANDFIPKELPGAGSEENLKEYAQQFSGIPTKLSLYDESWAPFSAACRNVLRDLTSLTRALESGQPGTSRFFVNVLNARAIRSGLPGLLQTNGICSLTELQLFVVRHILWLFRRLLFFVFLPRERYLAPWITYFTSRIPNLRPRMLGYDQVWLNSAMLVEFIFNVVSIGQGLSDHKNTPGNRSYEEGEVEDLKQLIGETCYETGMNIWMTRNHRRYNERWDFTKEDENIRNVVCHCINFIVEIGVLENLEVLDSPDKCEYLTPLRRNLKHSAERINKKAEVVQLGQTLEKLPSPKTSSEAQEFNAMRAYFERLTQELSEIEPEKVIEGRRLLLSHFLTE